MDLTDKPHKVKEPSRKEKEGLSRNERMFLRLVNGKKSVNEIASLLNIIDDRKVEQITTTLQQKGFIR